MSILRKLRNRFIWSSEDSMQNLRNQIDCLHQETRTLNQLLQNQAAQIADLQALTCRVEKQHREMAARSELRFWPLYRQPSETDLAARQRFFNQLPPATGSLAVLQRLLLKMLRDFETICARYQIENYWLIYGSLLGAIRHRGFIPWDDDLDLGIMRPDLLRLVERLQDHPDYTISIVWDKYVHCQQFRFRPRNSRIPGFIDLFPFDWVTSTSPALKSQREALRQSLIDRLNRDKALQQAWEKQKYMPLESETGQKIAAIFEACQSQGQAEGWLSEPSANCGAKKRPDSLAFPPSARGIIRAIDNLDEPVSSEWIASIEQSFPLAKLEFAGKPTQVPRTYGQIIHQLYRGNIYELPNDIVTHYQHVSDAELEAMDPGLLEQFLAQ